MSVTPPTVVSVAYQPPAARALSAAQRTGLAALISAILLGVLPMAITFLQGGDFSRASVQALLTAAGVVALTVILAYVQKLSEAKADDAKAAPIAPGEVGTIGEAVVLPALPLVDSGLLVQLVEKVIRESLTAPEPPPATISHRVVTNPPAPVPLGADAPVKWSHHAAKVPTVAPLETVSDS